MSPTEAYKLVIKESEEGIAYTSRMGDYSSKENFDRLIEAIYVLAEEISDEQKVERKLFGALFIIGNQIEGNMHGALAKGLKVPEWLWDEGIVALNEALYGIFETE